jgi:hypothetical protein
MGRSVAGKDRRGRPRGRGAAAGPAVAPVTASKVLSRGVGSRLLSPKIRARSSLEHTSAGRFSHILIAIIL